MFIKRILSIITGFFIICAHYNNAVDKPIINAHPLHHDSYNGIKIEEIKKLATIAVDVRTKKSLDFDLGKNLKNDHGGTTPLMLAVYKGHLAIVKVLLDLKADVNAQDDRGQTPLHYAILADPHWPYHPLDAIRKQIIYLLLAHKASPFIEDDFGVTPLSLYSKLAALVPGSDPDSYTCDSDAVNSDELYNAMKSA